MVLGSLVRKGICVLSGIATHKELPTRNQDHLWLEGLAGSAPFVPTLFGSRDDLRGRFRSVHNADITRRNCGRNRHIVLGNGRRNTL
jgi:hypothetical protein